MKKLLEMSTLAMLLSSAVPCATNAQGTPPAHTFAYVDSEELTGEDGSASNAIGGQSADFWHSAWKNSQPKRPHLWIIDLGPETRIGGFRYTPRVGSGDIAGRIKDSRIFVGNSLAVPIKP